MSKKQSEGGLQARGAVALYATILVCSLFFFLLGVYVGNRLAREHPGDDGELPQDSAEPVEDPRPKLDFYENIRKRQPKQEGDAQKKTGSGPEIIVEPGAPAPPPSQGVKPPERRASRSSSRDQPAPPGASAGGASQSQRFTIQVAALKQQADARQILIRLEAKGYAPRMIQPTASDPDFYRVWVGAFDTPVEAAALERKLKSDDFQTYLKKVEASRIGH